MSSTLHDSPFLRRFDALWSRLRRVQLGQTILLWGLIALAGLTLLMAADFWLELSRPVRAAGMLFGALFVLAWGGLLARAFLRSGTKPRTAVEIERSFPQLGQSIRTTVQYGDVSAEQVRAAGVREALVTALEQETHARSRGLHLDSIVPTRQLWIALSGLAGAVLLLLGILGWNWEWRVAASRTLLAEVPYTEIAAPSGDLKIDQGSTAHLRFLVSGRTGRNVRLLTRPAGDAQGAWTERDFAAGEGTAEGPREMAFAAKLESIRRPLEYKGVAGPAETPVYRIDVRYPLALRRTAVELTPPAYTNHPPHTSEDLNITAVEGTTVRFQITLDQAPRTASLVFKDLSHRESDDAPLPSTQTVPLELKGAELTAVLPLTGDMKYSIVAETDERARLPENSYRIRVRPDQPPEVYFEEPRDPLEVHTLAEVLMRVRLRDDFGLSRAGIMFEVNNEEEYPLLSQDFATAAEELKAQGKLTPETQAALEKVLPLEFFQLKMTDSVAYYAFAEDNYPGTPHRSVTDLRFVDIRPFRIRYSVLGERQRGNGTGSSGPRVATLEELIRRQRFNLNRSMSAARRAERQEPIDLVAIDGLVSSESELAGATRQLADELGKLPVEGLMDEIQLLLQAEAHMLAAADSLSAGKYDTSVLQQRDALKELLEGRNKLREAIQKDPSGFGRGGFGAADRRMAQKLRRPKSSKEEGEEVVRRLRQLAADQTEVQSELMASALASDGSGESMPAEKPSLPMEKPGDQPSPAPKETPTPMPTPMPAPAAETPPGMTAEELHERQGDNVLEAEEIETSLAKLKNVSDLAKKRMTDSIASLEGARGALDRGDRIEAIERSSEAVGTLDELASQLQALIKEEAAERLNEARRLAAQLAEAQQDLAARTPGPTGEATEGAAAAKPSASETPTPGSAATPPQPMGDPPGSKPDDGAAKPAPGGTAPPQEGEKGQKDDEMSGAGAGLARQAERNAATAKSLVDILQSILRSTDPADKEVIGKIEAILKENKLEETVARMQGVGEQLREGRYGDAQAAAADSADRLEAFANRLGVAFREVVAPRLQDLLAIERQLEALQEKLKDLRSEREVIAWHLDAARELKKLETMGIGEELREKLKEKMKESGWSEDVELFELTGDPWILEEVRDAPPQLPGGPAIGYSIALQDLSREVQAYIQELILGELARGASDATPPQYEKLVDRYYEVLARQKRPGVK